MVWTKISKKSIKNAVAYCDKTEIELFRKYVVSNDIVSFKKDITFGTTVLNFFKNGGRSCGKTYINLKELYGWPFIDHYMFYKNSNGDVILTSQPRTSKEYIIEKFNEFFTDDFELTIYDTNDSWYAPGETILFVIKLKNKKCSINDIVN